MFLAFGSRKRGGCYWKSEKGYFGLKRHWENGEIFQGMIVRLFAIKLFRFDFFDFPLPPALHYPHPKPEQRARSIDSTDLAEIDETCRRDQ